MNQPLSATSARALAAAQAVARRHGLAAATTEVLHDRWNLVVGFGSEPVVMRVATITGQVRADTIEALLRQEVALVAHLAREGAPTVGPSVVMPAGPHRHDGMWLVAMAPVPHDPQGFKQAEALGRSLRVVHRALATFDQPIPALDPLGEVGETLLRMTLQAIDRAWLQRSIARLQRRFDTLMRAPCQPLHGDSHRSNVLVGPAGPIWIDFEEACRGPVGWDLACLLHRLMGEPHAAEREAVLQAYGVTPEQRADLPAWCEIRSLVTVVWALRMAQERGESAEDELQAWCTGLGQVDAPGGAAPENKRRFCKPMEPEIRAGLPILHFAHPEEFRLWLGAHHATSPGIWLKLHKKHHPAPSITYAQALDEALCLGWIDSTKNAYDADSFLQRFSLRKPRSVWSQVNREHVARLEAEGRMQPAGRAHVEAAQANGTWQAAYARQSKNEVPPALLVALAENPDARAFFDTLNKANRYAFCYRVQLPKTDAGRAKRVAWAIALLSAGQTATGVKSN
jgi:uncharacterized protein YdeI (YjbR/CyaY-like superfamily)